MSNANITKRSLRPSTPETLKSVLKTEFDLLLREYPKLAEPLKAEYATAMNGDATNAAPVCDMIKKVYNLYLSNLIAETI